MRLLFSALVLLLSITVSTGSLLLGADAAPANMPCDCWDGTISTTSPQCTCSCVGVSEVEPYCAFKLGSTTKIDIVMNYTHQSNFSAGVTEIDFARQIESQYNFNGAFPDLGTFGTTTSSGNRWNGTFSFVIFEDPTSNALARAYPQYPVVARFLVDGDVAQMILDGVNRRDPGWTTNLSVITAYPFLQDPAPAENLRGFAITATFSIYDVIWVILILVICCCCCCECCCFFTNTERKAQEKANLMAPNIVPAIGVVQQPQVFQQPPGVIMPVSVVAPAAGGTFSPTNCDQQQQFGDNKEQPEMIVNHGENEEHQGVDEQQESSPPGMVV